MSTPSSPVKTARPLEGCRVGISISESEELSSYGLTADAINVITVDLARRIMALGGSVLLGHDWRTGGVMEAVARFAISYAGQNASPEKPMIVNYLAQPDQPSLSESDRVTLEGIAEFASISWARREPEIMQGLAGKQGDAMLRSIRETAMGLSRDPGLVRKLDLSAMRYFLADKCDVRIVIGGKTMGYQGLAPGIVEEAWWQLLLGKRLIVCEGMGGAALGLLHPDSPQALRMLRDEAHPHARSFLEALFSRGRQGVKVIENLQVEAILRALLPRA
jgi:hypothetical protein